MRESRATADTMHRAGNLRKESTPAEVKLWSLLRGNKLCGVSFRRQHAIGPYVVDFRSLKEKLIIEVDGEAHRHLGETDAVRTHYLVAQGYRVIRFWNRRVMDDGAAVVREIMQALNPTPR